MRPFLRSLAVPLALTLVPALVLACGGGGDGGGDGGTDPDPSTTGDLRVTVTVSSDGSAEPGVTVRLYPVGGSTASQTLTTGASGQATFQDVEEGQWDVEIDAPELTNVTGDARRIATVQADQTAQVAYALALEEGVAQVLLGSNLTFSPANLTIGPGTTVRWKNMAGILHTVTPDGHEEWSEATFNVAGDVFTHTFQDVGDYPYYCVPHRSQGMEGTVTVQ